MRESDIEKHLVKRVKELGGEIRKVAWIGRQGAPDRLVMVPQSLQARREASMWGCLDDFRTIWIELKRPSKAATFPADAHERKQHREHERMRKMGQRVEVVDSIERVEEILR